MAITNFFTDNHCYYSTKMERGSVCEREREREREGEREREREREREMREIERERERGRERYYELCWLMPIIVSLMTHDHIMLIDIGSLRFTNKS